jgi:hypothetical protein
MKRSTLLGLLALTGAACDVPLLMVEVEAPEVCVTQEVNVDATTSDSFVDLPAPPEPQLPSQLAADLTDAFETEVTLEDNVLELPAEFKDMLDAEVQIKLIRLQAKDDPLTLENEALRLDGVNLVRIVIVPADATLPPKTIIAYDRAASGTPPGGAIEAAGDMFNIAEYAYAGQIRFDYGLNVSLPAGVAFAMDATLCVATKGRMEATYDDLMGL